MGWRKQALISRWMHRACMFASRACGESDPPVCGQQVAASDGEQGAQGSRRTKRSAKQGHARGDGHGKPTNQVLGIEIEKVGETIIANTVRVFFSSVALHVDEVLVKLSRRFR